MNGTKTTTCNEITAGVLLGLIELEQELNKQIFIQFSLHSNDSIEHFIFLYKKSCMCLKRDGKME